MTSAATLLDTLPVLLPTLDLASVLTLRRVSVATQIGVAEHLASYLQDLLRRYLPDPQSFLSALTFSSGYIVGSLAVAFLLRDAAFHPDGIDVVLPHSERFTAFLFHLLTVQHGRLEYHSNIRSLRVEAKRGVCAVGHVRTPLGYVYIYQSKTRHALLPVTMSSITAQYSYVTAGHFGCAYPDLLFERRALLGDVTTVLAPTVADYESRGFSIKLFASHWSDRADEDLCASEDHECPAQERTFYDEGALRCRIRPLERRPLKPRVAWRLDVRPCGGLCFHRAGKITQWDVLATVF